MEDNCLFLMGGIIFDLTHSSSCYCSQLSLWHTCDNLMITQILTRGIYFSDELWYAWILMSSCGFDKCKVCVMCEFIVFYVSLFVEKIPYTFLSGFLMFMKSNSWGLVYLKTICYRLFLVKGPDKKVKTDCW